MSGVRLPLQKRQLLLIRATVAVALGVAGSAGCVTWQPAPSQTVASQTTAHPAPKASWTDEELAKDDALAFLKYCRRHYLDNVRDYRCKFLMRERAGAGMGEQQIIAIEFREKPYSVEMVWLENPAGARRISYVEDRWVKEGRQLALVVPSGLGSIVLPGGLKLDIHGREFTKSSSRCVDQFGFRKTLERAIRLCEEASDDPTFSIVYAGRGEYSERPQYVIERRLPYSEGEGTSPERLAVILIDVEWLTPTAVWSYSDERKQQLLGEFITSDVEFNTGLADSDFE